ncbi:MAG: Oxidoreductase FAD/NAD(P)-binding protein [uncultured bacterium (gcode 4)]|uniref:Oxidoreductase FAD/NAD(P)-binding protein n=1 Tax=uncultured bacterium (gcode 4) TaxID=1234023 RepID=K2GU58_9BACT|nr:MAG: Oxidoreductase FAD/NAD(P)-binding protein [uncultured bacterium (gcode 4)]
MNTLKLIKKTKLTHDVYELVFDWEEHNVLPGQFITFVLPSWLRRAYSISFQTWRNYEFIVKRLENWRWWSKQLCDIEIWTELPYIWPVWHFVLKNNEDNKLFIWTWTWFAPLYFQFKKALDNWIKSSLYFIFWVRNINDIFYEKELNFLKNKYTNFDFELFLSKEEKDWTSKWYVTEFLNPENIKSFSEFYICWSSVMVECSRKLLEETWVKSDKIYFEKY